MVHLCHPSAHGDEVLHGLAAVVIIQVALEGILHCCQVHVGHCCSITLLQGAANLLDQVPNLNKDIQLLIFQQNAATSHMYTSKEQICFAQLTTQQQQVLVRHKCDLLKVQTGCIVPE